MTFPLFLHSTSGGGWPGGGSHGSLTSSPATTQLSSGSSRKVDWRAAKSDQISILCGAPIRQKVSNEPNIEINLTGNIESRLPRHDLAVSVGGHTPVGAPVILLSALDSLEEEESSAGQEDPVGGGIRGGRPHLQPVLDPADLGPRLTCSLTAESGGLVSPHQHVRRVLYQPRDGGQPCQENSDLRECFIPFEM